MAIKWIMPFNWHHFDLVSNSSITLCVHGILSRILFTAAQCIANAKINYLEFISASWKILKFGTMARALEMCSKKIALLSLSRLTAEKCGTIREDLTQRRRLLCRKPFLLEHLSELNEAIGKRIEWYKWLKIYL